MNSPQGIRANAEEAGFNPLAFVGPGTGTGAGYAPQMGSIIANGFAAAADQWTNEKQLQLQKAQLEQENERLKKLSEKTILTPKVGGIYSKGGRNDKTTGLGSGPTADLTRDAIDAGIGRTAGVAPGREVEAAPYQSTPLVMEVHNELTGDDPYFVAGSDGDPLDIWQGLAVGGQILPQMVYRAGRKLGRTFSYKQGMGTMLDTYLRSGKPMPKYTKKDKTKKKSPGASGRW